MKHHFTIYLIAACAVLAGATASFDVKAQSEASAVSALSAMPLASAVASDSAVVAFPLVLSTVGYVFDWMTRAGLPNQAVWYKRDHSTP